MLFSFLLLYFLSNFQDIYTFYYPTSLLSFHLFYNFLNFLLENLLQISNKYFLQFSNCNCSLTSWLPLPLRLPPLRHAIQMSRMLRPWDRRRCRRHRRVQRSVPQLQRGRGKAYKRKKYPANTRKKGSGNKSIGILYPTVVRILTENTHSQVWHILSESQIQFNSTSIQCKWLAHVANE